jgi:5-methylcytosine-specific restriction protein A
MPKNLTGKYLNQLWEVGASHALYREDGKWYHQLRQFPGALFDANGFIVFWTEAEYLGCEYLQIKQDLHIPLGISAIPGYVRLTERKQLQTLTRQIKEVGEKKSHYSVIEKSRKPKQQPSEPRTLRASDFSEPKDPKRILSQTYRILRDTKLARWVKYIHEYKCQICGTSIELQDSQLYAEAHHIKPLGEPHNGPDVLENIICVCPNHHAQLDYGAIELIKSELILISGHEISDDYAKYHNTVIFNSKIG